MKSFFKMIRNSETFHAIMYILFFLVSTGLLITGLVVDSELMAAIFFFLMVSLLFLFIAFMMFAVGLISYVESKGEVSEKLWGLSLGLGGAGVLALGVMIILDGIKELL